MRSLFVVVALGSATVVASADPKFEYGKSEELEKVKAVEWTAAAELGIVFTTGNSETTSVSAGLRATRKTGQNKLSIEASMLYAKSALRVLDDLNGNGTVDGPEEITTQTSITAETYASKLRYDRFLTKFNSIYIAGLASRDVPAGKEAVFGGQIGYSRQVYKSKTAEAVAELGYDYSHEDLVTGPAISIHSARGFLGYKAEMTPGTTLESSIEALTNLNHEDLATRADGADFAEDTRVNAKVAISAKIGKTLAFQTSIDVKYDHRPAPLAIKNLAMGFVPEASSMDTLMKASLIYTFF
jgi:hypothetical protein